MRVRNIIQKKILITLLALGLYSSGFAKQGDKCSDPIVLVPSYQETITTACTKWYIANTFDLPMAIDFYPSNSSSPAPELYLDFSCTPGVYDDPILCGLFCSSNSAYISLPYHETPPMSYDGNGNARYHVEFGTFYRDLLLKQGIDYNVPVYIKVVYSGSGSLQMDPDPFNNCMDGHKFMHLGDTVNVKTRDKDRHVIVPYVQWQFDSIRYVWTGTTPCTLAIGNTCGFDPTDAGDEAIMDGGVLQPGGQFKVSSALLMRYVSDQVNYPNDAGMYFAKFYSDAPGVMKIEQIPAPPPGGGAIVLKYGVTTRVNKNDTATVYAMPDSWIQAMQFTTPTDHIFKMYIGQTPGFYTTDAVATYQFDKTADGHVLSLFESDLTSIWTHKKKGENYLYVRFECTDNTTVLPVLWTPSDCMTKAERIVADKQFEVGAKSKAIYSLYYEEWRGGDMSVAWTSAQSTCPFFIADTCDVPNANTGRVFYTGTAPKRGTVTVPQATVESWAPYVDPDGYLYIRFYSQAKAKITVSTTAPEEEDPQCSPEDSILVVSAWDSYTWRGTEYTQSGVYYKDGTVDPETGCMDTLFTLRLTIHTTSYDTYSETGCDSIEYNDKKYTESGVYTDTVYDAGGNRTIMTLNFTINYPTSGEETLVACDSLMWKGEWRYASGDYEYVTTNAAGCDSIVTLHLTINHPTYGDTTAIACESFAWYGTTYTQNAEPTHTFTNSKGCDSIVTLHLTIVHPYDITLPEKKVCDSYVWGDTTIYDSGTYTRSFQSVHGCDSVVTQTITVGHSYPDVVDQVTAYDSYTWINGMSYTKSIKGPSWELSTVDDCDSLITLDLTIRHLVTDTFVRELCPSELPYEWFGKYYTESGIYASDTIPGKAVNSVYVDTVHAVNLTVLPVSTGDTTATACESFTWYGTTYKESAEPQHTLTNIHGCDSVVTLHLTINHATAGDTTATACEAFTWYGTTYTESAEPTHTFTNSHGCDSVVTLHLAIYHATSGDTTATACESFTWHGETYMENGDYTFETKNSHGCDSTATLHLTIYHATAGEESRTEYESYTWHGTTYTESGDYTYETKNSHGCDSTATLHLTIEDRPHVDYTYDTVYFCQGYNTEHEELISKTEIRRYRMYVYESPAEWAYQDGLVAATEGHRIQLDLRHVEQSLEAHYIGELEPIKTILWTYRKDGETAIENLTSTAEPIWKDYGRLTIEVRFTCGHIFSQTIKAGSTEGIDDVNGEDTTVRKVLKDGQIYILRGNTKYSILGGRME